MAMPNQHHIFAFGHNIHQKTCPSLDRRLSIREPVDIVPSLIECLRLGGVEAVEGLYDFEVIWSGWDRTIVREIRTNQHLSLGRDPLDPAHRLHLISNVPKSYRKILGFDLLEGFLLTDGRVKLSLSMSAGGSAAEQTCASGKYEDVAIVSSGEVYASSVEECGRMVLLHYKDLASLANRSVEPLHRYDIPLPPHPPLPPSTSHTRHSLTICPGHSHILIHHLPLLNPTLSTLLTLGDNRHKASLPSSSKHTITHPTSIPELEGWEVYDARAGMGKSAAKVGVGGVEGAEWWMWGKGVDGVETVKVPKTAKGPTPSPSITGDEADDKLQKFDPPAFSDRPDAAEPEDEEDPRDSIKHLELGDGYEIVVPADNRLFVRGRNDFGQLGLNASIVHLQEFVEHPFFVADVSSSRAIDNAPGIEGNEDQRCEVSNRGGSASSDAKGRFDISRVTCSRWSTFVKCRSRVDDLGG